MLDWVVAVLRPCTWAKAWCRARTRRTSSATASAASSARTVHKLTEEGDYTVEEVDALTGPLIGLPKSASFRLIDIVGLDVWVHVAAQSLRGGAGRSRRASGSSCPSSCSR